MTVLGAAALAGVLAVLGSRLLPRGGSAVMIGMSVIVSAIVVRETVGRAVPIPQVPWQVPRQWLRRYWVGAGVFGGVMGMGIFTRQPSALFFLYLLGCVVSGRFGRGVVWGFVFGGVYLVGLLRAMFITARSAEGDDVFADWASTVRTRIRWVGVFAAPLVVFLPLL